MNRAVFAILVVLAGTLSSGTALAAREPFQECQLAFVKLATLYDKLYWKLYGTACKKQEIDAESIAKAQAKMDKAVAKFAELFAEIGAMGCDPDDNYAVYANPTYWEIGPYVDPIALLYCNGESDI